MHLKTLEINGFKSFANRTKLQFEPGMTAIVGPNGCGKSNVADAIRWVLGEQSAKALRGSKMDDVIFSGTDTRKPVGMADVSITFTNCEGVLDTEFHEVTITRRILRDGSGQYFINKTPCRLKDIQRLFMDTGIGTTSYSMMEQGKIDRILSSRPEDRRAVFEEASGITKYKADKKEALRKLEQTEANLLRLADVIREVKRQIGSLQRQAGKARRYKEIRDELRALDLHLSQHRLRNAARRIEELTGRLRQIDTDITALRADLETREAQTVSLRDGLVQAERNIAAAMEAAIRARGELDHTRQVITMNTQRIDENRRLKDRDARELDEASRQLEERRAQAARQLEALAAADTALADTRAAEQAARRLCEANDQSIRENRTKLQSLRQQALDLENDVSQAQNQLQELENSERSAVLQRERLFAEKAQIARGYTAYERRRDELATNLRDEVGHVQRQEATLQERRAERIQLVDELQKQREARAELQSAGAARQAQIELIEKKESAGEGLPGGARLLLDAANPLRVAADSVLGRLADHVSAEPDFARALEAILRAWADAIVVAGPAEAARILDTLRAAEKRGNVRLVSLQAARPTAAAPASLPGEPLLPHLACSDAFRPVAEHVFASVRVVPSLAAALDGQTGAFTFVTRDGAVLRDNGHHEFWTPDDAAATPLSLKHMLTEGKAALRKLQKQAGELTQSIGTCEEGIRATDAAIAECERGLVDARRSHAQKEGELQLVAKEAARLQERLDTVEWEIKELTAQGSEHEQEKAALRTRIEQGQQHRGQVHADIETLSHDLQQLETRQTADQHALTDKRILAAQAATRCEQLRDLTAAIAARIEELTATMNGRTAGLQTYEATMAQLTQANAEHTERLATLASQMEAEEARADGFRTDRNRQAAALAEQDAMLAAKRRDLETLHGEHAQLDVQLTEERMRRETQADRVTGNYGVTLDQVMRHTATEEVNAMPMDLVETTVAELNTKLEAMGPVNLVAIEEHQELQERCDFLTQQEQDLVNSKQQLMDMIRKINRTSSELFRETFDKVNEHFQRVFEQLFNGGTAKLVLVNEEDVLECGIEIIARPPGKRLQNVSLLSGGERTLTAVALLFAIYLIKPSPFCLLDELDAALDDSNIGRFVKILKGFMEQSQFVVITHNRQTIAASDVLYGVTMQEKGVSNIVSLKFSDGEAPEGAKQALVPAR